MTSHDFSDWDRRMGGGGRPNPAQTARGGCSTRVMPLLAGALTLLIILGTAKGAYAEWLWFDSVGYGSVYTTILQTKVLLFFASAIFFFILFMGNLALTTRLTPKTQAQLWPWALVRRLEGVLKTVIIAGVALVSLIFGLAAQSNWEIVLRFFNGQPFGVTDPIFHREVSFYVFSLPFLHLIRGWLLGVLIVTLIGTAAAYILSYSVQLLKFRLEKPVLAHIGGLLIAILGLFAWGYRLSIWELVFSERGVAFGASYADINAKIPAQWVLLAVVLLLIGILMASVFRRDYRWPLYGLAGWVASAIIVGGIFPGLVQRLQVQPSELAMERPYIEHNIRFTREAFALDRIEEQAFPAETEPSRQAIARNEVTINNIRLWDPRPLKDTYNQIQSIRLYYDFNDVDIDRYEIDGQYRQVMLSARELSVDKLTQTAQTWVNRRLQFTHGYGLALSPVNEITPEGLPVLMVKDLPPAGKFTIERPQIYFGERTNHYVIVGTRTEEFDYPMGNQNVFGHYEGKDGVSTGSFFRRLLFAWQFGDFNILISNELTPESKVLYYRNIKERVQKLAPFLMLDRDPYLVITDGRLVWIQDAYTTTDSYPYSQPLRNGVNYLRNSVKVVVDAYDGSVDFYIADPEDALIQTYQAIFPQLFLPMSEMPESLRAHLRYPEDMFNIQAAVYQTYHMRDARVFYNKEDLWAIPREVYAGTEQPLEPYYVIMRLPGEEKEEFLLMQPFTPVNKNNTIGWLAARSDGMNYGRLLAYNFPKEKLVYGPSQIENRIQQDTIITEQFALWDRGGSRVIRGNLLLIPLEQSFLYVEPIFLQAEAGGLPELKRVIVAAGDRIAMEPTLERSIAAIFGTDVFGGRPAVVVEPAGPGQPGRPVSPDVASLIEQGRQHYQKAEERLRAGDWAGYGKELESLKAVLEQLAELTTTR
jgi:uncharacterized protein